MQFNDKEKKRMVALTRELKRQKGLTIKNHEMQHTINTYKKTQKEILSIKDKYAGNKEVESVALAEHKKLQEIIDELNQYMAVIHPEGLIDFSGKSAPVAQG